MKVLIIAAAALACAASPAMAQTVAHTGGLYGSIGYAATDQSDADLGAIQGRFGARLHPMLGIEGEAGFGVNDADIGDDTSVKLDRQLALYGVGFVPIGTNFEAIARVGYGNTKISVDSPFGDEEGDANSWNFGVGGQFWFTDSDAVRADWTRHNFDDDESGGDLDVWSVAYVRRF